MQHGWRNLLWNTDESEFHVTDFTVTGQWKVLFVNSTATEFVAKVESRLTLVGRIR